jgi:hypothetical protein
MVAINDDCHKYNCLCRSETDARQCRNQHETGPI